MKLPLGTLTEGLWRLIGALSFLQVALFVCRVWSPNFPCPLRLVLTGADLGTNLKGSPVTEIEQCLRRRLDFKSGFSLQ